MLNFKELMRLAYVAATNSPDPSTQNGAILVTSYGRVVASDCNRFPRGYAETHKRLIDRSIKYKVVIHAEESVLWTAAFRGDLTRGLIMVCPWAACFTCARSIIEFGVSQVVVHADAHERCAKKVGDRKEWGETIELAREMMREAGVEYTVIEGKIGAPQVLHVGQVWRP